MVCTQRRGRVQPRKVAQGADFWDALAVLVSHDAPADDDALLTMLAQQELVLRGADDAMPNDLLREGAEGSPAHALDALLEERRCSR